jgi:hypothetical protein
MPNYRNKITNKTFEAANDEEALKIIEAEQRSEPPIFQQGPGKSELKAPTNADYFYNAIGRKIPPLLKVGGGALGSFYGGGPFVGGSAGTIAGSSVAKILQEIAPSYFGTYSDKPLELIAETGMDIAGNLVGEGAGKALGLGFPSSGKEVLHNITKKLFKPTSINELQYEALKADPNFKISVGDVNPSAKWMQNVVAPAESKAFSDVQQKVITGELNKWRSDPELIGEIASERSTQLAEQMKATRKAAYESFDPYKTKNTQLVKVPTGETEKKLILGGPNKAQVIDVPIYETQKVSGAIPVIQSKKFVNNVLPEIEKKLGPNDINAANLGSGTGGPLVLLRNELNKIDSIKTHLNPATDLPYANPISDIDQLKAVKDGITNFLGSSADKTLKDQLRGGLNALKNTIQNDIDKGVEGWGKTAQRTYERAKKSHVELVKKFDPDLADELIREGYDPEITHTKILEKAMSDPKYMRQFVCCNRRT